MVFADATQKLDVNNLRYQDILLHLAHRLVAQLKEDRLSVDDVHLKKLQDWFTERVEKQERTRTFAAEAKAGARGAVGASAA